MFVKDESCIEEFTRIGRLPSVRSCTFGASEWEEEEEEEEGEEKERGDIWQQDLCEYLYGGERLSGEVRG